MNSFVVVVVVIGLGVAASSLAQTRPPEPVPAVSTSEECRYFVPGLPPNDGVVPTDAPTTEPPDQPSFGSVFVVTPPAGTGPVPRNVEILLGGTLNELDQGFWDLRIDGRVGSIPFERDGARIVPEGGLLPPGTVKLSLTTTAAHPCNGCFSPTLIALEVTNIVDATPPTFTEFVLHDVVPPPLDLQTRCGSFAGTGDVFEVSLVSDEDALVGFSARNALLAPRNVIQTGLVWGNYRASFATSLTPTQVISAGDDVVIVARARDLAGNLSPPLVTRLRARSMTTVPDATTTILDLPEQRCELDAVPEVRVPEHLPRNASLRVVFPFEEQPLALQRADELVPLVPGADVVEDARVGRLFAPARPVEPGPWTLVNLPCTRCVCPDCTAPLSQAIVVDDVVDTSAPAAPVVRALLDDAEPPRAEGRCAPDHAATLAVLAPGDDDIAGPFDLTYDVVVRLGDGPLRPLGQGLVPFRRADGDVVLRLPTASFGRIVDADLTLEITARDTAGNASTTTWSQGLAAVDGGCAASGSDAGVGSATALLGLALRRRRRRRRS